MKLKPRYIQIDAHFDQNIKPDSIDINPATGGIQFMQNSMNIAPNDCKIESGYSRTHKIKILRRYPVDPRNINVHTDYSIWNFDTVYVIDTNTKGNVSVTGAVRGKPVYDHKKVKTGIHFRSCAFHIFRNLTESPEKTGWQAVIKNEYSPRDGKTGIVVDSELGQIDDINASKKPILGDYYLPHGIRLIYASVDAGKECIINKVISKLDTEIRKRLSAIIRKDNSS